MADRVGQQLGSYRLLRKIGQGSFAEVYLGEHQYLERLAAIKVLHVQMGPKTQEQFRHEARTIARLDHPHIVRVLDFGIEDQTPYLVMEYTSGGTLSQHPKGIRLSLEQIVHYVKQIASALDYAHGHRVIHRDIKPDNLLLNAKDEIVLSDFGLAVVQHTLDSLSTQNPAGTPLYMAPEQIQRKSCAASDQYALGIIVYEWLAREVPFRGSLFEVFSHHLYQPPPSLRERLPDLPVAVEEAVFKALAKAPENRFACVADFASALEQACSATQQLTLQGPPKPRTPELTVSQRTPFAPPSTTREPEGASTQPVPTTVPRTEHREEVVPAMAPGTSRYGLTVSKPVKPSLAQSNRQRFLRRVRAFWIEGVLEHSLHGAALIALGLQEQLDALANPWHLVLQHPDTPPHSFPLGTRITDVYDAANGELLILGAPGSGKTTLLLELARDLLERAEHDEQHLMPVVFTLSSWAAKQPLTEWMVEELIDKYDVPRKLARNWVDADLILPLLDGLDEVAAENRAACIETVNTYHQEHAFLPLVVSTRSADYLAQTARIRLTSAVTIQPLTQQQVDDYLARGGEALWALRVALHQDAALRDLTETPLMLSILTLTYHDMPVEDLFQGDLAPTRQQVFEHYTERMLRHRGAAMRYPQEQTTHWLSWLARQMKQRSQTIFYIEHLQPDWLSGVRRLRAYGRWAVRFPGILMGMFVSGIVFSLGFNTSLPPDYLIYLVAVLLSFVPVLTLGGLMGGLLSVESTTLQLQERQGFWPRLLERLGVGLFIWLSVGLVYGLVFGLSIGLSYGLIFGLCSILLQILLEKSSIKVSGFQMSGPLQRTTWQPLKKSVSFRNGVTVGLLLGLSYGLNEGLVPALLFRLNEGLVPALLLGLNAGLVSGLFFGLSAGLLSVLLIGKPVGISLTDKLVWSWRGLGWSILSKRHVITSLRIMVLVGLIAGLSTVLLFGLSYGLKTGLSYALIVGPSYGLIVGLSIWLLLGLFQGVSSQAIEDQHRILPNQGIRRSARNGLVAGLIGTGIAGLAIVLSNWLINELVFKLSTGLGNMLNIWLIAGPGTALLVGLLVGFLNGGLSCLRHSVLRLLLWRAGSIPWNYPRFLDFAAEHILLRKVGGGYIFVHRLLLEYFASLYTTPTPDATRAKKEQA